MKYLIQLFELEQALEKDTSIEIKAKETPGTVHIDLKGDQLIRMQQMIAHEIEAVMSPANEHLFTRQWLGDLQEYLMVYCNTIEKWAITFDYEGTHVINPYKDVSLRIDVDPNTMYGDVFNLSDWTYKAPLVLLNLRNTMANFIKYAVGDDSHLDTVDFVQVLAQFVFEAAHDIIPNDFVAQDAREALAFLVSFDSYYTAMELLVQLFESDTPAKNYDVILDQGLKGFRTGKYKIV